jgi:hypothetical protein
MQPKPGSQSPMGTPPNTSSPQPPIEGMEEQVSWFYSIEVSVLLFFFSFSFSFF